MSKTHKNLGTKPPSWKGKHHSQKSKNKTRDTLLGHIVSRKTKEKLRKINLGKHHSVETKKKLSEFWLGPKNPRWKGGITTEIRKIRNSMKLRLWREAVFARDNFTCQDCGQRGGRLQAHHVKAFKLKPELRYEILNGITLCIDCHKKTDTYGWQNYWKSQLAA